MSRVLSRGAFHVFVLFALVLTLFIELVMAACDYSLRKPSDSPQEVTSTTAEIAMMPAPTTKTMPTSEPTTAALTLNTAPVLPTVSERARQIYADGLAAGRNPAVFSRIGDCMTTSSLFLVPFAQGDYDLGEDAYLQSTIDYYLAVTVRESDGQALNSFNNFSMAATEGFNSASVQEPLWANPAYCRPGESPLTCELRESNPSVALIMFGTNDVYAFEPEKFEGYMRGVIEQTVESGVVPVLFTFPPQPDYFEESRALNAVIVQLADEYEVPLVNLWRALEGLPYHGINPEQINHLTVPEDGCAACFDDRHLQAGITVQNRVALLALHEILQGLKE